MNAELPPIPRLTTLGDAFTGVVTKCWPQLDGEPGKQYRFVYFTFEGYAGALKIGALGVDGKLLEMGFYDKPDAANPDGVVRYDEVAGERLTFERVGPMRGQNPLWRIVKATPPSTPTARPVTAPVVSKPPVTAGPTGGSGRGPREAPRDTSTPEERRTAARARMGEECERVLTELVPRLQKAAKKQKVKLRPITFAEIFQAAQGAVIAMERRGCA